MTMKKVLHAKEDIQTFYVTRKDGATDLTSIENYVNATIQLLEECTEIKEKKKKD